VLTALRERDEETAFAIGAAFGSALFGLVVALIVRGVYRLIRKDRPILSPWLLLIAGVVTFLALIGRVGRESEELAEGFEQARTECESIGEQPLPEPPPGISYRQPGPAQKAELARVIPTELDDAIEVRVIQNDRGFAGAD